MLIAHSEKRFHSTLLKKLEFCIHHPSINYKKTLPSLLQKFFSVFSLLQINILVKNSSEKFLSWYWPWSPEGWGVGEWMQNGMVRNGPHSRGGSRIFFRRGCTHLLLYFNTNKPHSFVFCRIQVVLENCKSGGVRTHCTLPLDPPLHRAGTNKSWRGGRLEIQRGLGWGCSMGMIVGIYEALLGGGG